MKYIYLLFTDTGSLLTKTIKLYTKQKYNHVSLSLTENLEYTYSFGRKQINNPFIGGFVHEDLSDNFFLNSNCKILRLEVTESQYNSIYSLINQFKETENLYHYNLLGLINILTNTAHNREDAYFCSEWVSYVIELSNVHKFTNPTYEVTPELIMNELSLEFVFEGILLDYYSSYHEIIQFPRFATIRSYPRLSVNYALVNSRKLGNYFKNYF